MQYILKSMLFIGVLSLIACSSTYKLSHSASDPNWQGKSKKRIMVVGLAEWQYRIPFENTFVMELKSRGIDAVASHKRAPDTSSFDSEKEVEQIVRAEKVDGILTVQRKEFRQANNAAWGAAYLATWFLTDNYQTRRDARRVIAAGQIIDNLDAANYAVEIEFWDAETFRSLWVGKTEIFDAGESNAEFIKPFADIVIGELKTRGMMQ